MRYIFLLLFLVKYTNYYIWHHYKDTDLLKRSYFTFINGLLVYSGLFQWADFCALWAYCCACKRSQWHWYTLLRRVTQFGHLQEVCLGRDKMTDLRGWATDSKSSWFYRFCLVGIYRGETMEPYSNLAHSERGFIRRTAEALMVLYCTALWDETGSSYFNERMLLLCRTRSLIYFTLYMIIESSPYQPFSSQ